MTVLTRTNASTIRSTNPTPLAFSDINYEEATMSNAKAKAKPNPNARPEGGIPTAPQGVINTPLKAKPPSCVWTPDATNYLAAAIDKACEPKHPNFVAKMNDDVRAMYQDIRVAACFAYDLAHGETTPERRAKAAVIGVIKKLGPLSKRHVVQFMKDIASDCAFAAHMDIVVYERASSLTPLSDRELGMLDNMLDAEPENLPSREPMREPYAGPGEERVAKDANDVEDSINAIQVWLAAICQRILTTDDLVYWGLEGVFPLGSRKRDDGEYIPLTTLAEYRAEQDRRWKQKQRTIKVDNTIDDLVDI